MRQQNRRGLVPRNVIGLKGGQGRSAEDLHATATAWTATGLALVVLGLAAIVIVGSLVFRRRGSVSA